MTAKKKSMTIKEASTMEQPILSCNTRCYTGSAAFEGDTLNRKKLAEKLNIYLARLNDGAVLAIDAPWGEGKTWFGRNWAKDLQENGKNEVIFIDSFEQDYIEDPFILISSAILNSIKKEVSIKDTLLTHSMTVAKTLLPLSAKALLNFGGRVFLGQSDIAGEVKEAIGSATSEASDIASQWIKKSFEEYEANKVAIFNFKETLSQYAKSLDAPLVIFIDELDRCKPTFAVSLIERMKHFFDVPNVVFILLLNKDQLEKAIKGVYGSETDASAYLGKFVNFFFRLPKYNQNDSRAERALNYFIETTMSKYKFTKDQKNDEFVSNLQKHAVYFDLSLREIEKCVALYAFSYPVLEDFLYFFVHIIVLKVKFSSLFDQLVENNGKAHEMIIEQLKNIMKKFGISQDNGRFNFLIDWHTYHSSGFATMGQKFGEYKMPFHSHVEKKDLFSYLAKKIDIDMEL